MPMGKMTKKAEQSNQAKKTAKNQNQSVGVTNQFRFEEEELPDSQTSDPRGEVIFFCCAPLVGDKIQ
jgi:hypothetical protein